MGQGKNYELVATADSKGYSMLLQKEKTWKRFDDQVIPEYTPFANYQPLHLKNLRRGLKLFLQNHWPSYARQVRNV